MILLACFFGTTKAMCSRHQTNITRSWVCCSFSQPRTSQPTPLYFFRFPPPTRGGALGRPQLCLKLCWVETFIWVFHFCDAWCSLLGNQFVCTRVEFRFRKHKIFIVEFFCENSVSEKGISSTWLPIWMADGSAYLLNFGDSRSRFYSQDFRTMIAIQGTTHFPIQRITTWRLASVAL